jgi:pimeloyl-ACP methyl ester carboxylesterase
LSASERQSLMIDVEQDTIELSIRIWGNGPSILCLHGLMHSSEIWMRVTKLLEHEFQIIALDLPGFGLSPPLPASQINLVKYARIIRAALDTLSKDYEISAIVADSLSTRIVSQACELGLDSSLTRVLLSGCPFDGLPLLLRIFPVSFFMKPTLWLLKVLPTSLSIAIIGLFARYTVDDISTAGTEISYGVLHTDPTTAQRMFDALKEPISVSAANCLGRYKCVLLRGKFDRVESHSSLSARARKLSATYVELSMSGHTPMIEEPANYAQTIRDLMR